MSDPFDRPANAALKSVSTSLLTATATTLAGPGAAIFAGAASASVLAWFGAVASRNDATLEDARIGALEEEIRKLADRLRKLEEQSKLDHDDPLSRAQVFSDFARDVAGASSTKKREALVNAAARRFDPRAGSDAVRAYWYGVVRQLSDRDVALLRLLTGHDWVDIRLEPNPTAQAIGRDNKVVTLDLSSSELVAFYGIGVDDNAPDALFQRSALSGAFAARVQLTPRGKVVAGFIAD